MVHTFWFLVLVWISPYRIQDRMALVSVTKIEVIIGVCPFLLVAEQELKLVRSNMKFEPIFVKEAGLHCIIVFAKTGAFSVICDKNHCAREYASSPRNQSLTKCHKSYIMEVVSSLITDKTVTAKCFMFSP